MHPLTTNNVLAELSYAYLHAVASRAGVSCKPGNRHEDDHGIDAQLTAWGPFPDTYAEEVDLKVQLKATTKQPTDKGDHYAYFLQGTKRYDDLRRALPVPRILVVLFLPEDAGDWLQHTEDSLLLRRCAYWVSLRGAPATDNESGATVLLPKAQTFGPEGLVTLFSRIARLDPPGYEAP